ncbi:MULTISPECIES: hypothetical protein [unclassified Sphingomonas]|uniref:hypothetical protein n=1 Tax=unclassified Sphingomonas TaxID=196159 RepID=UPI0006F1D3C3|nr:MULTISPECIES: hypothetical protein [unclassified Sphingomonas]KQM60067.1 hypothetical protein ASE65_10195 [Sphingomonas sp. Leaf16]KQN11465.1 hypothetical protein ASE81_11180 [Sphingomonas sp. Leaf29]KQN18787.1 hypothetical protein ASE83_11120 [Sphingomonas sp. Leaf32]
MAFENGDVGGSAELLGGAAGGGDAGGGAAADGGAAGGDGAATGSDGAAAGESGTLPDWFEKVSADAGDGESSSNRDWLSAKGVKDLDGLVKMSRDTEKALRESGRIKVPGENAKPDELAAFHTAIGVPDKADGYEVQAPEGVQLDDAMIGALRESALKHGTPKGAFAGLVSDFVQIQIEQANAEAKRQDELASSWVKEQGGKADEQLAHINTAARSLGLSKTDMSGLRAGLGADRALGLLAKLGAGMAEDVLITGGSNRFGVSGAEAQGELERLKGDADFQAKNKPGTPERARWDRVNAQAAEFQAAKQA